MMKRVLVGAVLFVLFLTLTLPVFAQEPIPVGVPIPTAGGQVPIYGTPSPTITMFPTNTIVPTWTAVPTNVPSVFWVTFNWNVYLFYACPDASVPYCQFNPLRWISVGNGDYKGRLLVQQAPRGGYYEIAPGNWYWGGEHWAKGLYIMSGQVARL
jgi:hypothetical protein